MSDPIDVASAVVLLASLAGKYKQAWGLLRPYEFLQFVRETPPPRPRLSVDACRLLHGIALVARSRRVLDDTLVAAASDRMDGLYLSSDPAVIRLVQAGLIEEVPIETLRQRRPLAQSCTWHLTPYGCAVLLAYGPREAPAS